MNKNNNFNYIIISDVDNSIFNFSKFVLYLLSQKKISNEILKNVIIQDPYFVYDFVSGNDEYVKKFFINVFEYLLKEKIYTDIKFSLITSISKQYNIDDIYIVSNRKGLLSINDMKKWIVKNINSQKIANNTYFMNSEERINFIENFNKENKKVIFIEDNPYTIKSYFRKNLHKENILYIPIWKYNFFDEEIQNNVKKSNQKSIFIKYF